MNSGPIAFSSVSVKRSLTPASRALNQGFVDVTTSEEYKSDVLGCHQTLASLLPFIRIGVESRLLLSDDSIDGIRLLTGKVRSENDLMIYTWRSKLETFQRDR